MSFNQLKQLIGNTLAEDFYANEQVSKVTDVFELSEVIHQTVGMSKDSTAWVLSVMMDFTESSLG